ncbi:MAG TPA: endonuclease domain-containing protein, partial [Flavipsychrobacter sp.]|nr:endonuclease domain-containing protein [Flavipsychrobacter sp.]
FRRQHPLYVFVVDFYCHSLKLAIEVDGCVHQDKEVAAYDAERQKTLEAADISFLRFTDIQVLEHLEAVSKTIENFIKNRPSLPEKTGSPL